MAGPPREAPLGWLGQSSILPRKKRVIEGVSGSSLLGLQAALYDSQQGGPTSTPSLTRREGLSTGLFRHGKAEGLAGRNKGIDARNASDAAKSEASKAQAATALERKARLYEDLAAGRASTEAGKDFEVDFESKLLSFNASDRSESSAPVNTREMAMGGGGGLCSADMAREWERRAWEHGLDVEAAEAAAREARKQIIKEVNAEVVAERARAAQERLKRTAEQENKHNELKKAFLQQYAAKVKKLKKEHQ
ncbi:hypothetical protein H632_c142p0 [Helicosporidium sp. ATCC 50920]|nr:hypothetical protein H632_c142p0 [Helicosporidium sp. ATCC 50920]|eukprot:KDD76671.1 hypothetical protein H632_c142p0 [Helicosporidium sp. ATCC 50920]